MTARALLETNQLLVTLSGENIEDMFIEAEEAEGIVRLWFTKPDSYLDISLGDGSISYSDQFTGQSSLHGEVMVWYRSNMVARFELPGV